MKQIPLSGSNGEGKFAIVDDEDYEAASAYTWHLSSRGYAVTKEGQLLLHHLVFGKPSSSLFVDHIDGNPLNNQKTNLRFATYTQNAQNRASRRGSSSRFKGVSWHSRLKDWKAEITCDGIVHYLGHFMSELDAARAYNAAAAQYHGEFARLNIIPDDTVEPVRYRQAVPRANNRTSQYRGVYFSTRRQHWCARIEVNHKNIYLGSFDTPEAAARAYDAAAKIHYGDRAFLNFPG